MPVSQSEAAPGIEILRTGRFLVSSQPCCGRRRNTLQGHGAAATTKTTARRPGVFGRNLQNWNIYPWSSMEKPEPYFTISRCELVFCLQSTAQIVNNFTTGVGLRALIRAKGASRKTIIAPLGPSGEEVEMATCPTVISNRFQILSRVCLAMVSDKSRTSRADKQLGRPLHGNRQHVDVRPWRPVKLASWPVGARSVEIWGVNTEQLSASLVQEAGRMTDERLIAISPTNNIANENFSADVWNLANKRQHSRQEGFCSSVDVKARRVTRE